MWKMIVEIISSDLMSCWRHKNVTGHTFTQTHTARAHLSGIKDGTIQFKVNVLTCELIQSAGDYCFILLFLYYLVCLKGSGTIIFWRYVQHMRVTRESEPTQTRNWNRKILEKGETIRFGETFPREQWPVCVQCWRKGWIQRHQRSDQFLSIPLLKR